MLPELIETAKAGVSAVACAPYTLKLIRPIALASLRGIGAIKAYTATADLTLHGHTRQVTFPLRAERTASLMEVSGSIPIVFANWGIPNPSFTGFVTTQITASSSS